MTVQAITYAWAMRESINHTPIRPLQRLVLLCLADWAGAGGDASESVFRRSDLVERALMKPSDVAGVLEAMEDAHILLVDRTEILPDRDVRYTVKVFWNLPEEADQ